MTNPDRLSGLDTSFLLLEDAVAHMHVAACAVLEGLAPSYQELVETVERRLHLIPRYRQRLQYVPLGQGRPVWVDDPQFRLPFHIRHTALPRPGSDEQLKLLAGRIFSQALDRQRPLWELWMVEGLSDGRFALLTKTHHALVHGLNIASILFDPTPTPPPVTDPPQAWAPKPLPSRAQLVADALVERATTPGEVRRSAAHVLGTPIRATSAVGTTLANVGGIKLPGRPRAPQSPYNVTIGPHRRFTWVNAELDQVKAIKNALGGTVNDVVLAAIAGGLGAHMRRHGYQTEDVVLRALVPISVSALPGEASGAGDGDEVEADGPGTDLTAMWAPLPVGVLDPAARLALITRATAPIKNESQPRQSEPVTDLTGFAPPTLVAHAARLQAGQDPFNLVVTNIAGPQSPMYFRGRELQAIYSLVPLAQGTALGIAVMSYNGQVAFSLSADYDRLADLEDLADDLSDAIAELAVRAASTPPAVP